MQFYSLFALIANSIGGLFRFILSSWCAAMRVTS